MEKGFFSNACNTVLVTLGLIVTLTSGCADGPLNRAGGVFDSVLTKEMRKRAGDAELRVQEYSACFGAEGSEVGVACKGISTAEVEVFIDGTSVILDFSNVSENGTISEEDFEGFLLSAAEESNMPPILGALVDKAKSHMAEQEVEVDFDYEYVAINLQGLRYDDSTFIKVDLAFEER